LRQRNHLLDKGSLF